ncbi:MAG: MXAN_2562 family outer membrane beta-barrel protein [bacterium]
MVLLLLAASPAFAQFQETDRSVDVQIRAGAYLPDLDSTFPAEACKASGQCPYEAVFQNDDPVMIMLGAERHLVVDYGTLSFGGAVGYWNVAGKTLIGPGVRGNDSTELTVIPMMLQATYKLDVIQDIVPVVPVLRAGLDYYYWRVLDGEGEVASFAPGEKAEGGTWGWHYTYGVHILLDYFAPEMAADFDRDAGVNNSYVTIEVQQSDITDFGSSKAFRLGGEVLFFGLGLDI